MNSGVCVAEPPAKQSQKKAARVACGAKWIRHADPCFSNLQALKFQDMFKISCAKVALKSAYGTQIDGLTDCFIPTHEEVRSARNEPNYGPSTRLKEKNNLIMPPFLSAELRKMPSYRIPEIWNNEIPPNLRDMGSLLYDSFKSQTIYDYSMFQCNKK